MKQIEIWTTFTEQISAFLCYQNQVQKLHRLLLCKICLVTCIFVASPNLVFSEKLPQSITVKGQIRLPSGKLIPEDGLNVVLLKLVLGPEGQVTPVGPQGRVKTDPKGKFEFTNVRPDLQAGYQLGTRVDGELYSSKVFFIKPGETFVENDIVIPGISTDVNKLETTQVSLVIESGLSTVTVTEVLSFNNPSPDRIDTRPRSLVHELPKGLENFRMIQSRAGEAIEHQIQDNLLVINHVFPPGNTQIVFQYNIAVWFGSLIMHREFNHSLDKVSVFTPEGHLQIKSDQLNFFGKQNLQETAFLAWKSKASDSNQLKFKISNVPVHSLQYAGISAIILILLFASVFLFYRKRLIIQNRD